MIISLPMRHIFTIISLLNTVLMSYISGRSETKHGASWTSSLLCAGSSWTSSLLCAGASWTSSLLGAGASWTSSLLCAGTSWTSSLLCVLVLVEPVLFCVCWCCGLEKGGWSSMVAHVVAWSHINVITRETIKRACIFNYLISIYREKKKEKDREDLWKKLESLEVKSGNKNKLVNNVSS